MNNPLCSACNNRRIHSDDEYERYHKRYYAIHSTVPIRDTVAELLAAMADDDGALEADRERARGMLVAMAKGKKP